MICNISIYALGLVELQTMSKKIQNKQLDLLMHQTILCVKVMPVFEAVVVSSSNVFSFGGAAWRCECVPVYSEI